MRAGRTGLLIVALFLSGCAARLPAGPAVIFDAGSAISAGPDAVIFITEIYSHATASASKDFPLQDPVTVDEVAGNLSYYDLNGRCGGKNIATVFNVDLGNGAILVYDLQSHGGLPFNLPVNASFPGGITMSKLRLTLYDDLCHPTDLRVALAFHRMRTAAK